MYIVIDEGEINEFFIEAFENSVLFKETVLQRDNE